MAQPPKKRRPAPPKSRGYEPEDREGKLYRVRDKDYGDGAPVKIWGENLSYESAQRLKEKVCGSRKSRTARIEEMSAPLPGADPTLETARQRGLAAGRGAAIAAQQRADQLAQRRQQETAAASAPKPRLPPALVRPATPKPAPPVVDLDDTDLEAPEVADEEEIGEGDEVGAVTAAAEADINEYELKGKELWDGYAPLIKDARTWDDLNPKERAALSFEAAAGQGPHIAAVSAASHPTEGEQISDASSNGQSPAG